MKKNLTELVFILDRSGSMGSFVDDVIGGFNSMIEKYKEEFEEAYVTTVLFDDRYQILHNHLNLKEINPITRKEYYTWGSTALFDAVGRTINFVGERLFNTPEEERPEKVIFVINTDGEENSSREFTRSKVKAMIKHQQEKYSWGFLFLGANIDAEREAESIGISSNFAATYTASSRGVSSTYDALSDAVTCMACCDSLTASNCATSVKSILDAKVYNDCDAKIDSGISSKVNCTTSDFIPLTGKISYIGTNLSNCVATTFNDKIDACITTIESIGGKKYSEITDMEVNNLFGVGTEN